ncbi:Os02g0216200 [Oryza sativa Japonica Group]|uniref:Os02g0216200 protein n=1 Tax=Oryza sativa subsp. japonica TaxID=39947 RepID=Q0E2T1_ORYSJ|nr:hypothetical protein DAI22_02g089800 [Oryza sativa Japonica Group]BAF08207.1 Os02g0216200 [Oryza sativa Japonica Group]|eukprot:NP_001046293.1 Os02g0216200 [Oryza sativa Japonica Group]
MLRKPLRLPPPTCKSCASCRRAPSLIANHVIPPQIAASPASVEVRARFLPSYSDVKRICLPSYLVLFLNLRGSVLSRCFSAGRGGACSSFNLSVHNPWFRLLSPPTSHPSPPRR